ncbi:MAG: CbiX/SirB N-terminal domain-containing protein [Vampirovibrio sp.]|nr:CbiX/SirB N-terminal domain-containing protein [Vampirovibrio sp.]
MTQKQLVLYAHGSRDPRWKQPFEKMLASLQESVGATKVSLAYMEMATPTLTDVARQAAAEGVTELTVLPIFWSAGAHVSQDIPRIADSVHQEFPNLTMTVLPPAGEHPKIVDALMQIAADTVT